MKQLLYKYYPELNGLIVFSIYLNTMCPTILGMDSGELATVQATLSIAHPSGYPLFAWVGYLFLKLPIPFEPIIRLNILAAIWCSLTIVILIRTSKFIIENLFVLVSENWKFLLSNVQNNNYIIISASIFPGLMFGFSQRFWLQSTHVEVHSLQMFLVSLIIYLSIKAYIYSKYTDGSYSEQPVKNNWIGVFIIIGLAFANHLTIVYLILPTVVLFFLCYDFNVRNIRVLIFYFFLSFAVALIFYLWMMFRAASIPPFKYGDPSNLSTLYDHITAKRYSKNMFTSFSTFKLQFLKLIHLLSFNFSEHKWGDFAFSIVLGIAGFIFSSILFKRIFLYLILVIFITLLISLNYSIPDIEEYFLPVFYILCFSAGISVLLIALLLPRQNIFKVLLIFFLFSLITFQVYANYKLVDKSNKRSFENFAKKYIESLPPNAVLYTDNWSDMLSPLLYLQNVKQIRRDILIFSPWRRICFTPYQSTNTARFYKENKLIIDDNTFIFDSLEMKKVEFVE